MYCWLRHYASARSNVMGAFLSVDLSFSYSSQSLMRFHMCKACLPNEKRALEVCSHDYHRVDASADESNEDWQHTLTQVRSVVHDVHLCTERDAGVHFLRNIHADNVFVIVSGYIGQQMVPDIHGIAQLRAIYILCGNKHRHAQWTKKWDKIKGVHTGMTEICQAMQSRFDGDKFRRRDRRS